MAEHEGGTRVPLETQVREQFSAEWKKADTADKKKSLLQRLLEMIKDTVNSAKTAVDEAEKQKSGSIPPNAKDAKESAAQPVIQLFQFLTGNAGQPLDNEALKSLNLTETQLSFLKTLGSIRHNTDTATFLSQIVDKTISDPQYLRISKPGETKTQLEQDFETVKLNGVAGGKVKEGMLGLARQGRLVDTQGNKLTEDDINNRFQSIGDEYQQKKIEQAGIQNNQQSTTEQTEQFEYSQATVGNGRRREKKQNTELTRQYERYMNLIRGTNAPERQALESDLRRNEEQVSQINNDETISVDARQRELQRLQAEQNQIRDQLNKFTAEESAAIDYLYSDQIGPPFSESENPTEAIKQYIKDKFGVSSDADIEQLKAVFQNATSGNLDGSYEGYQDLADEINFKYTEVKIRSRIIKNGVLDLDAVKELQAEIEDDIGVLFETLYNSPKASFQDAFSSYSEGQMLRKITQHLRVQVNKIIQTVEPNKRNEFKNILTDMIISPIQRRPSLEQIVHQYQQVGATIDLEKLKDILKTYNITTLQEFYNDDLTKIISDLMPAFVQKMFVQNGNEMVTDLFQLAQVEKEVDSNIVTSKNPNEKSKRFVVKYREECIDYMYDIINGLYASQGRKVSKDRINARFSRAYLDNFLLSLRGIKVMSNALPMHHKFGDVPFVNLITGVFNPLQGWGKFGLRGRGHQESGDAETTEFQGMNNFVFNEIAFKEWEKKYGDVFDHFHPAHMKKEGDKRIMFEVFPDNKELMHDLHTGRWDAFNTMLDSYKGMVFGNIIDQSGWTFDGFNENILPQLAIDTFNKSLGDLSRKEKMELKYRTSGVVTAFWDVDGYAAEDTMNQFVKYLFDKDISAEIEIQKRERGGHLADDERKKIIEREVKRIQSAKLGEMDRAKTAGEYTKGDKRFDKIFDVTLGDKKTKVAFREYRMHRINAIKGEIFHQLLLKDPNAWLGEMVQNYPQLRQGYVTYDDSKGNKNHVRGSEFYFDLHKYPDSSLSKTDKEKRDRFRFEILTKFRGNEEENYMTNVPHLQKIMNFYARLVENHVNNDDKYKNLDSKAKTEALYNSGTMNEAIDILDVQLSIAHQKAVTYERAAIDKEFIADENIRNLMFDDNGLITHFNDMVTRGRKNYFGDGETDMGEENGFYQRWSYSKEQTGTRFLPEGDTNMKYLFEDVKNTQALDRRLNTDMAFAKAQEVLGNVPSVCKKAADADNLEGWFGAIEELHKEMSVIADEDQAMEQKYQQILYQTICNWFSMDSDTEKMFIGFVHEMRLGVDAAMATLKSNNMTKFILDQDNRRQYLNMLRDKSYLKGNYDMIGGWGFDTAELVAGVGLAEIVRKQAMYALAGAIVVTIATAIKEGYEEEVKDD